MLRKRLALPVACALIATAAAAQDPQPQSGRTVYELVAESVFLVQTETKNGEALGQGTAFLIDNKRLMTNAHVVREGKVFLKSAGFKIECTVDARDELNDLALLTVPAVGVSRPLRLADELPKPGDTVFAIGNPQGLERTISHGLYTGPRSMEGRDLLQVSASISQGSSGGPIVNAAGEVVGVAAGFLSEGQNLNFAVPLAAIRALLSGGSGEAVEVTNAADPYARIALARALRAKGSWLNETDKERLFRLAENHVAVAIKALRSPLADHFALLAGIQEDLPDKLGDSYLNYKRALELRKRSDPDEVSLDLFHLFVVARRLSRTQEAKSWFAELKLTGKAASSHYRSYARFLHEAGEYAAAGDAYVLAAGANGGTYDDLCSAATSFWTDENLDSALAAARQCIELGASVKDSEGSVAYAHRTMSLILVDRGVYDEAISHAKQAIAIDPKDGWAYYSLARGLRALNRYDEAIATAKNALRVTDGKYASMHFVLGSAYFGSEDWPHAASAYKKAAEMEPTDAAAAYNVAAALYNERSYRESLWWWEEVLRRDPDYPDRVSVLETIREIRPPS